MTRIAVLADIHGNLPALENVAEDMKQFAPDHVVVLGDMISWGPFSVEVLQLCYDNRWTMLRGNNEFYCINATLPRRPAAWSDYALVPWVHEQLHDWHHFIASLPDDLLLLYPDAPDIHACHGVPGDCWLGIQQAGFMPDDQVRERISNAKAQTILCGHTHIPLNRTVDDTRIINPGTVGVPLLGSALSSYMILDGDKNGWQIAEHRHLPFEMSRLFAGWEEQNFIERGGATARMVQEECKQSRSYIAPFNRWMQEVHPGEEATLEHAEANFYKLTQHPTPLYATKFYK